MQLDILGQDLLLFVYFQLFLLRNEKESISNAEKKACNVIHTLHERLNHLQVLDVTKFPNIL